MRRIPPIISKAMKTRPPARLTGSRRESRLRPSTAARHNVFEAGDGPPLVFLHGAGGLAEESPFLAALARRWHVFAPLLPGYGDSEGGDTLPDMLAITLHSFDVIEALGLTRPYLVGHSMGGMIAAEMAAVAPNDVERLGLIAPAGLWLDDHPIPDLFATLPHELPELLFHDPVLGERLMAPDGDLDNPKLLEAFMIRNARRIERDRAPSARARDIHSPPSS